MDLNQLLFRHQVALLNVQHRLLDARPDVHCEQARHYATRIQKMREVMGVPQYCA